MDRAAGRSVTLGVDLHSEIYFVTYANLPNIRGLLVFRHQLIQNPLFSACFHLILHCNINARQHQESIRKGCAKYSAHPYHHCLDNESNASRQSERYK
jgi:hypothetical protein